jgi:hypothetical protein
MKYLLMIAATLLALTGAAAGNPVGGRTQLFDEDGKHIGVSVESGNKLSIYYDNGKTASDEFYRLNGRKVSVFTDEDGNVEVRWIQGTFDRIGGFIFGSDPESPTNFKTHNHVSGSARLDRLTGRRGCDYWFSASLYRTNIASLYRANQLGDLVLGGNKSWDAKCKVVFRPDLNQGR